jgi:arginyl-tRNA synthetase
VALSAATARALGYVGGGEEEAAEVEGGEDALPEAPEGAGDAPPTAARPAAGKALEMSGRKGIGVKADDLLDQLVAKAGDEVAKRNRELAGDDLSALARDIATAALRFLMVRATTTRVIAFDLDEALEFEGETGPYLQYSSVRPRNIRRRLAAAGLADEVAPDEAAALPAAAWGDDLWHLVLGVAEVPEVVARAGASLELSLVARHALELAQRFNALYHRHPILQEEDRDLRTARLAAVRVYQRGLEALADLLGIPLPERM